MTGVALHRARIRESMLSDGWEDSAEVMRSVEPALRRRLAHLQTNSPDPVTQPVSSALGKAYLIRLEIYVDAIGGGAKGLRVLYRDYPNLEQELEEMETWIVIDRETGDKPRLTAAHEESLGDWLVSRGRSYSQTRQLLRRTRQLVTGRGAPNKRPDTLRLLDAKISQTLSYKRLASQSCDCGLAQHTEHCEERIRKRIKELEKFLARQMIVFRPK